MGKAKLILSSEETKSNPEGKWYVHDQIKPFIQGIVAGELDENQVSSTLVSGVPTPWARAKMIWFAMDYLKRQDANIETSGLIEFYKKLQNEWMGLLAVVALYPDRVSFSDPIYLDKKDENFYGITGAFGRLLFEDSDIWTDQVAKQKNPDELPFVQLVYYNNQLVGGTSPFSIVFPGVDYRGLKNISDIGWYRDGKFENPKQYLDKDKKQKLYLFIKNINNNFSEYEKNVNLERDGVSKSKLDLEGLKKCLRDWMRTIENDITGLQQNGTVAKYSKLAMPYKALLDSHQKVYQLRDGSFTFTMPSDQSSVVATLDDLQNILKDDPAIIGWLESNDYKHPLSQAAVYYLKVNDIRDEKCPTKYFALPLSMQGIRMFTQQIGTLVSHQNPKFDIVGKINDQGKLIVDITITIDNQPYKLNSKEYEIEWSTTNNKVIMWPDFISDNWDAYYLYSEYPSNIQGVKFIPFYKQGQEQKIITVSRPLGEKNLDNVVFQNSSENDKRDSGLNIMNLVNYPAGQVPNEMHKYEVTKSNRPIAGLEIRIENAGKSINAGYLIVKNPGDTTMGERRILDLTTQDTNLSAKVGIDFGSNNTCVHYTSSEDGNNEAKPIHFVNRRLALVGTDSQGGYTAERDELLFFSNEQSPNGQIKSWLHEHDIRYIGNNKDKEIAGGVAVNENNILVLEMDKQKITTQAGILHYNMKWLSDIDGLSKKTAYLKSLWLSICADLYVKKCKPVELRWSFPGSMSTFDKGQYHTIYNTDLPALTPIFDKNTHQRLRPITIQEQTESESVCKYALSKEYGLDNNMFVGIDVGGSTSDILLLAKDINNGNTPYLYKQSSVRLAAGVFFDAVIRSNKFRNAIYGYHESQKGQPNSINVEHIQDILVSNKKAPFYLNSVFDQLSDDNFGLFYSYIGREASFVYAIPAYVTGLLVYYAGKLCAKTIKDNNLTAVREYHLLPFGKGGRLFHWLQTKPGAALTDTYFTECFRCGYGEGSENVRLVYRRDVYQDNKSEVAKGLAVDTTLNYNPNVRFCSDIIGEKNIKYLNNGQFDTFNENDVISDQYFENMGQFEFPAKFENFDEFLKIFIDYVGNKSGLVTNIAVLENRSHELASLLSAYITNDAEYKKARNAKQQTNKFEYHTPILIAEGLCYLEKVLIPEIFKE